MDKKRLIAMVDHTALAQTTTLDECYALADDAIAFGAAAICISPCYVAEVKAHVGDRIKVGTCIGFPNGVNTTATKAFEAADAVANGADELDIVVNNGWARSGRWDLVKADIEAVREAAPDVVLKVIIETCLITNEEKRRLAQVVTEAGADYIKTSTGFSTGGATVEDVRLLREAVGDSVKVKAAGGIATFEQAEKLVEAGAERLGTSRLVKLAKAERDA